jgi:hypothetical protein
MYEKITTYVLSILSGFVATASGFWGWVVKIFFKYIEKFLIKSAEKIDNKVEAKKEAKEELEKYNEAIPKPNITKEERLAADRAFLGDN